MPQPPDNRTDIRNDERATLGTTMAGAGTRHSVETLIGRAAVERGLASRNQVLLAFELIKQYPKEERPARFVEVFVSRGVLTAEQIEMLRGWVTDDGDPSAKSGSSMAAPKVSSAEMIPGYRIERKLGAGAMGTVVLARQLSLDRLVAIKLLPKKFATDAQYIDRFYKEGKAAARLNDPNIVAAYDVGRAPAGEYFFVMEYVDGDTVFDRIQAKRRIGEPEALHIARQAASALRHAHEKGFIHRDVKPKNLMITKGGVVKLADLGLARAGNDSDAATEEKGKIFGTPYYISPEQIRAREVTPATDIYGLGATLYHMVTGRVPFEGSSPKEVMQRHLREPLTPPDQLVPDLSNGLSMIIEMMMAKDPRERYHSAADLIEDLDRVTAREAPVHARPKLDAPMLGAADGAEGATPVAMAELPRAGSPWATPVGIAVLAVLGLSVAANAVMALLLVLRKG
jgi:serine/threonine-protein kinase